MMSFRSQLWSLERATPHYGADTYVTYGDDVHDPYDELVYGDDADGDVAAVHAIEPVVSAAAVVRRRALAYRRRRQVLSVLALVAAAGVAPAVLLAGPWVVAEAVAVTLLAVYVSLLIRRGRREAERAQKVRYLTPIRAPRPSVVVIGTGAAR